MERAGRDGPRGDAGECEEGGGIIKVAISSLHKLILLAL